MSIQPRIVPAEGQDRKGTSSTEFERTVQYLFRTGTPPKSGENSGCLSLAHMAPVHSRTPYCDDGSLMPDYGLASFNSSGKALSDLHRLFMDGRL